MGVRVPNHIQSNPSNPYPHAAKQNQVVMQKSFEVINAVNDVNNK